MADSSARDVASQPVATESERRGLRALADRLGELQTAVSGRDAYKTWVLTREVLNWLHFLDEAARARLGGKDAYYVQVRPNTEDGRTLGALTFVRGIVHHHPADVQARIWRGARTFVRQNKDWAEVRTFHRVDDGWGEVTPYVAVWAWPALADLPESSEPKHSRDAYYVDHVEAKLLIEPLLAAQRFLTQLQTP